MSPQNPAIDARRTALLIMDYQPAVLGGLSDHCLTTPGLGPSTGRRAGTRPYLTTELVTLITAALGGC